MNKGYKWEVVIYNDKKGTTLRVEHDTLQECEEYCEFIERCFNNKYRTDIEQIEV